jgi:acetoacetyl-CoA synthetase
MNSVENVCLWKPTQSRVDQSQMMDFIKSANRHFQKSFMSYHDLHQFSVENKEVFWTYLLEYFQISFQGSLDPVLLNNSFEEYSWFSQCELNFAENLLKNGKDDSIALIFRHESGKESTTTYKDLKQKVVNFKSVLSKYVKTGDVVAAFMPNIPETVISMLATSSLGGTFTSTSCDFGIEGVLDRFGQTKPKVLIAATSYIYNEKKISLVEKIAEIEKKIPSLEKIILVNFLDLPFDATLFSHATEKYLNFHEIPQLFNEQLTFKRLPFSHPLYIMYSSGTTGKPKCIVHSQGGTLLQHVKELGLHCDLKKDKTIFFFTTCGWMMWNWLVSSLYFGGKVVLYEGSPALPSPEAFFHLIDQYKINIFGTSPKFLKTLEDTNAKYSDLTSLETILSTGSPLLPEQFDYVYQCIKKDVLLGSISGGTDIISCFMLANPILPVYKGEIQCLGLGMDVKAFDDHQKPVYEQEGELVCRQTFPSRPIYFLNDENNKKITEAYFSQYPNTWTHGDFIKITKNKGVLVYGRSDATLNPGGVRIGTAEIYRQTELLPFILDSLCVGKPVSGDIDVILFVKLKANEELTIERKKQIKEFIKKNTTPRHVPREIHVVKDIPYTRSGKKVELAIARILAKKEVTNTEALINPESLQEYYQFV